MPSPTALILQTERLELVQLTEADAGFVLRLVNEPLWLRFIGDRGVRTLADAEAYLRQGPLASYATRGFGLWLMRLRHDNSSIGLCGLIKRDSLPDVDVGFALPAEFSGRGYGTEAVQATLDYGWTHLGLKRIVAITDVENHASAHVLEKSGLKFEQPIALPSDGKPGKLFAIHAPASSQQRAEESTKPAS